MPQLAPWSERVSQDVRAALRRQPKAHCGGRFQKLPRRRSSTAWRHVEWHASLRPVGPLPVGREELQSTQSVLHWKYAERPELRRAWMSVRAHDASAGTPAGGSESEWIETSIVRDVVAVRTVACSEEKTYRNCRSSGPPRDLRRQPVGEHSSLYWEWEERWQGRRFRRHSFIFVPVSVRPTQLLFCQKYNGLEKIYSVTVKCKVRRTGWGAKILKVTTTV